MCLVATEQVSVVVFWWWEVCKESRGCSSRSVRGAEEAHCAYGRHDVCFFWGRWRRGAKGRPTQREPKGSRKNEENLYDC